MSDDQLFEDFSDVVTSTVIKKNWSVTYKGQEISGTYSYEADSWGFYDRNVEINEEHLENLSGEEIDEIHDYIEDVIS
jgi:hypothetical protein